MAQALSGLLLDLADEGVRQRFAGLGMTADDVPAVGKSRRSALRFRAKAWPRGSSMTAPTVQVSPSAGTGISTSWPTVAPRCSCGMPPLQDPGSVMPGSPVIDIVTPAGRPR